jgi:hypothetical protein
VKRDHSVVVVSSQKHGGWILDSNQLFPRPPNVVNRGEPICTGISSNKTTIHSNLVLQTRCFQLNITCVEDGRESVRALLDQIVKIFLFVRTTIVGGPCMSCR